MAGTIRIPTEFTAVDKFTSVVSKMTAGVSNFSKSAQGAVMRVDNKINKMWNSLDGISQMAIGVGVGGMFSIATDAAMKYETALHSLEAVTGQSSGKFKGQIEDIAKSTNKSAIDVAGAFEKVGSAMSQYLDNPKALGDISNAGIILSKAARMDLEPAIESVTSAMNQFNLGSEKALDTVNRLTAGEIVGSVSTAKSTEQLSKFGAVANSINVDLPESIALIQTLGKKFTGAMQSEIGTASKNLMLIMDASSTASKGASEAMKRNGVDTNILMNRSLSLGDRLKELSKIKKDGAAMALVFGKENATAGSVIFDQLGTYEQYLATIQKTNGAQNQASINSNTLASAIEAVKNSFINATVSGETTTGVLGIMKNLAFSVANNMGSIVSVVGAVIMAFAGFKAIVTIIQMATAIQAAYNAVVMWYSGVAVTAALSGASFAAVIWATVAPILAVIAAVGAIIAIFYYWNDITAWFGKQWNTFVNWIGGVWDKLVAWFQNFDFKDFFLQIGQAIIDFWLFPLRSVLELVAMLPGAVGNAAKSGLKMLDKINLKVGADAVQNFVKGDQAQGVSKLEPTKATQSKIISNSSVNGQIDVNVSAKKGTTAETKSKSKGGIPVRTTATQGSF